MIKLPEIIDAVDIFTKSDVDGIDKIASTLEASTDIPFEIDVKDLPLEKFACVIKHGETLLKKFPIDSKTSTELNIQALLYSHEQLPTEIVKIAATNLVKAAENWGIVNNVDKLQKLASSSKGNFISTDRINVNEYMHKISSVTPYGFKVFALQDKYPIDTPELLKQAENYFKQYGHRFDALEQYTYSTNMIKQAENLGIQLNTPSILKYANLRFERNPNLKLALSIRDNRAHTNGVYKGIAKMADQLPLEKLAKAVLELDKEFGLDKQYTKGLPDPIFTVFNSLEKKADIINGKPIRLEDIRAIPKDALHSLSLTADTIDSLQSDEGIEVLQSLPEPIRMEILDLV